jgi:hypothetical protein
MAVSTARGTHDSSPAALSEIAWRLGDLDRTRGSAALALGQIQRRDTVQEQRRAVKHFMNGMSCRLESIVRQTRLTPAGVEVRRIQDPSSWSSRRAQPC